MACGCKDIGKSKQEGAVGRDLFLSRPQEEQTVIQSEMKVISRPVCVKQNQSSCSDFDEYLRAWKRLAEISPFVGYKLLAQNRFEWPDSFSRNAVGKNGSGISDELWSETLAFQWIFKNTSLAKQLPFLEEVVADRQEAHPLVFLNLADYLLRDHTPEWSVSLANVRSNLLAGGAQVVDEKLGWKIRETLAETHRTQILSRPISPLIAK